MEEHYINHIKLEGFAFLTTYSRIDMPLNPGLKAQWKEKSVNILLKKNPKQTQSSEIFPLSPSLVSHTDMTTAEGNI